MNGKTSVYGLALLGAILVAFLTHGDEPLRKPEAGDMLRIFKGAQHEAVIKEFEKAVPLEERQEALFSVWAASGRDSEGIKAKSNVLQYLSRSDNMAAVWQPTTWLLAYGANGDSSADIRLQILDLVTRRNDEGVLEVLWAALGDEDDRVRCKAVEALAGSADASTVLGDYLRIRTTGEQSLPSVIRAKATLKMTDVSAKKSVYLSADAWKIATRLVEIEKRPPPREYQDMYAGKKLLEQLPAEQWSLCLCEAWILSSQLCSEQEYRAFRGWVLWYLSPHNPTYKEIEPAWSTRLESVFSAS